MSEESASSRKLPVDYLRAASNEPEAALTVAIAEGNWEAAKVLYESPIVRTNSGAALARISATLVEQGHQTTPSALSAALATPLETEET